jgi:hypothetical protein
MKIPCHAYLKQEAGEFQIKQKKNLWKNVGREKNWVSVSTGGWVRLLVLSY